MSDRSAIEWTEATWNPVTGCDRVSAGCDHCYAMTLAKRLKAMGSAKYTNDGDPRTSGPGFGVMVHPQSLDEPYQWRLPRVVFVNSMSDLFHARVPIEFIRDVFDVCRDTPRHTYQVLTKRSLRLRRVAEMLEWPPNLWMGVSIEMLTRFSESTIFAKYRLPSASYRVSPFSGRSTVSTSRESNGSSLAASQGRTTGPLMSIGSVESVTRAVTPTSRSSSSSGVAAHRKLRAGYSTGNSGTRCPAPPASR